MDDSAVGFSSGRGFFEVLERPAQAYPERVLEAIRRALRSDGVYLMQDIAGSSHLENNLEHSLAPLLYTISCMHCMTVSLASGGVGLGTLWGEEMALEMLRAAEFARVDVYRLDGDVQNNYYVAWPSARPALSIPSSSRREEPAPGRKS